MHHDIEEVSKVLNPISVLNNLQRHIFPVLAKRMPEFRDNDRHKTSHKLIHDGLDLLEKTVKGFKSNPSTYKPEELRAALDSFREPLYTHLAEEVFVFFILHLNQVANGNLKSGSLSTQYEEILVDSGPCKDSNVMTSGSTDTIISLIDHFGIKYTTFSNPSFPINEQYLEQISKAFDDTSRDMIGA